MSESSSLGSILGDIWIQSNRSTVQTKANKSKDESSSTDNPLTKQDVEAALVAHINQINEKHQTEIQTVKDDIAQINSHRQQITENLSDLKTKVEKFDDFKSHIVLGGLVVIVGGAWALYTHIDNKYDKLNVRLTEITVESGQKQSSTNVQISELSENLRLLREDVGKLDNLPSDIDILFHRVGQVEKSYSKIEDKVETKLAKNKS
ncbi:conserved hypothetical protein [Vibrio crassostreae]|uniref:hypothetical protein n=1 Tax=Vibrio crassostreae TaxID=246167 RepID=UPI000638E184|nr:hypothetical protein [Vibrio crassostreae]CAK1963151.1 conserved hypothetical protein [Vibrio crassostreae]CAK1967458.1 conserved hypothetical protein [Vibrio crassostreae]CAK1971343.1 conserved hypothetical protein [Vibrio crassostreae]CAK1974156.1 conserved hypothetical protein [Vibrio crassostreae]CAK1979280.1 conserved hypothetical protein [Vibrio crassostreae]